MCFGLEQILVAIEPTILLIKSVTVRAELYEQIKKKTTLARKFNSSINY